MNASAISDLIRRCFAAYKSADREDIESLLAEDFTFTSPYDDHIGRAAYFERCWPLAGTFDTHDLKQIVVQGNEGFVLYEGRAKNGIEFRNVEIFRVERGKIRSIEVFFGRPPSGVSPGAVD